MIRYYPSFRVKTNLIASGKDFVLNGKVYTGKYYETIEGRYFAGPNPILGKNEEIFKATKTEKKSLFPVSINTTIQYKQYAEQLELDVPKPYYIQPTDTDYKRGYIMRYFIKKINIVGGIVEVSPKEYSAFLEGNVGYDVSYYIPTEVMWKLTGPIHSKRLSQYDIRAGIEDTNKRLIENLDKTFLGIKEYIGGEYQKYARPTE